MPTARSNPAIVNSSSGGARVSWLIPPVLAIALFQIALLFRRVAPVVAGRIPFDLGLNGFSWIALQLSALGSVLILLWRLYLVARYRPAPSVSDQQLPEVTVIVPAYNEGKQVLRTLRSIAESDYPRHQLHIIAVDDGSVDDTWHWIERGAEELGELVLPIHCRVNRGKRHALYEGFSRARGEVIVTVDSDSEVLPDTLRNLVSPFVLSPRVGAVAGNVRVLNDGGVLGKMLDVSFTYAFEFQRASEGMVDTVACCPGALSSYRRSIVEKIKDQWLEQKFLGAPANIGEDRAMTNLVLRSGYLARFQSNAIVLTEVPRKVPQLSRMFLRWDRSNVRETLRLGSFVFTRFRPESSWGARVNFLWSAWQTVLSGLLFVPFVALLVMHPATAGWITLAALASAMLPACVFAISRGNLRALWAFPYAVFSTFALSWIQPYALLTSHRSSWLTRAKPRPVPLPLPAQVGLSATAPARDGVAA